jgi:hypothetical protein
MHRARSVAVVVGLGLCLSSCYRGYKSAKDLDTDQRGPRACAAACRDLGLQMSAFVLVEHQTSGCVCAPPDKQPAHAAAPAAAAAAVQIVDDEKKRAAEQQHTEQTSVAPP